MKSSLLLAAVAATMSLASCSSNSTTETTTTTTPTDSTATATTTTRTYTDTDYHTRGDRMAARFASQNKISDAATLAKLKTAYYNRAKRYDEMMAKFRADTAGMAQAKRDYMKSNDQEFQTILLVPAQYQAYQSTSSTPDYSEESNLDITDQSAAASSATMPSTDSTTTTETTTTTTTSSDMSSGAMVEKGKTKYSDGSKVKMKDNGKVKMKDADGSKTKM